MPAPVDARFRAFVETLEATPPLFVYCLPCTLSRGDFVCVAEFESRDPLWFSASCLHALLDHAEDVDVGKMLRAFKSKFQILYTQHNAVDVETVDGVFAFEASLAKSNNDTATSCVYALPSGYVLCFGDVKQCLSGLDLALLQRVGATHASTFDVVLFRVGAARDRAVELRLVKKSNLQSFLGWAASCDLDFVCSTGAPIQPSWVLDSFDDGISSQEVVRWIGGGSDESSDNDSEWRDPTSESDEEFVCADSDDDEDSDASDFDPAAAAAALANLS